MRSSSLLIWILIFAVPTLARADFKKTIFAGRSLTYGGFGYLFGDTTTFINPGQTSLADGATLAVSAVKQGTTLTGGPTFTKSVETLSLGAFYSRSGTDLFSGTPTSSYLGGMLGASIQRGKITVGGSYIQAINTATTDRNFSIAFNYNKGGARKNQGMSYGFGLTSTELGVAKTNSIVLAVGKQFTPNNGLELNYRMLDVRSLSIYSVGVFYVGRYQNLYGAAGYTHYSERSGDAVARLGYIQKHFDLSATITYPLSSSTSQAYGGILRVLF